MFHCDGKTLEYIHMRHGSTTKTTEKTEFQFIQTEVKVVRKRYITPHYIRIFFTSDDIFRINSATVGVNNKIMIPPAGATKVHFPEFDYENRKWLPLPDDIRPAVRTYTHRGIDLENNEIWIDFVAHGDEGPASKWAINAKEDDIIGLLMRAGKTDLYIKAEQYVLVGDATAIPVLSTILEDLPATAKGICIIEVHGKEDEQYLHTNADIEFIWLHNEHPQRQSDLAETLKKQILPEGSRSAYVAAEFTTVKEIRHYLRKEKGWKKEELYAYSYWKSGQSEDKSTTTRHEESDEN